MPFWSSNAALKIPFLKIDALPFWKPGQNAVVKQWMINDAAPRSPRVLGGGPIETATRIVRRRLSERRTRRPVVLQISRDLRLRYAFPRRSGAEPISGIGMPAASDAHARPSQRAPSADARSSTRTSKRYQLLGVVRFTDASIYRDAFPTIRIAILYFTIAIFFFFFCFIHNDFHLGRKET